MTRTELVRGFFGLLARGMAKKQATKHLAAAIVDSKRVHETDLIMADIAKLEQSRGNVFANVRSARPLDASAKKAVQELIVNDTQAKHVELDATVDTSLIGGAVIETAEKTYDFSIRGKLQALKNGVK